MPDSEKYQQCLEAICNSGCDTVRATIDALESNLDVSQTSELSDQQRDSILSELKAIMAVYDR